MDPFLHDLVARHGVFLRREALEHGYDDATLSTMLRHGEWVRVRHGAYTFAPLWDGQDALARHRTLCRAGCVGCVGRQR